MIHAVRHALRFQANGNLFALAQTALETIAIVLQKVGGLQLYRRLVGIQLHATSAFVVHQITAIANLLIALLPVGKT